MRKSSEGFDRRPGLPGDRIPVSRSYERATARRLFALSALPVVGQNAVFAEIAGRFIFHRDLLGLVCAGPEKGGIESGRNCCAVFHFSRTVLFPIFADFVRKPQRNHVFRRLHVSIAGFAFKTPPFLFACRHPGCAVRFFGFLLPSKPDSDRRNPVSVVDLQKL